MEQAGVPLLPGYHGERQDAALPRRPGRPDRLPGDDQGGRRRRRPRHAGRVARRRLSPPRSPPRGRRPRRRSATTACCSNAISTDPRHIEVQVFADTHGNAVHLFERDCSVQRRHQKVIEEAPAPGLDERSPRGHGRAPRSPRRGPSATTAPARSSSSRTPTASIFLEMNTRLQVEHPVTEMITGFDLVEWQLRVAAGEPLPAAQDADPHRRPRHRGAHLRRGSRARLRAIHRARWRCSARPSQPTDVRIDTGFATGDTVSDPLRCDARQADLPRRDARRGAAHAAPRAGRDRRGRRGQQSRSAGPHRVASGVRRRRRRYRLHRAPRRTCCSPRSAIHPPRFWRPPRLAC